MLPAVSPRLSAGAPTGDHAITPLQGRTRPGYRPRLPVPGSVPGPLRRTRSSAGEHLVDIEGVTGSIPVASTIPFSKSARLEMGSSAAGIGRGGSRRRARISPSVGTRTDAVSMTARYDALNRTLRIPPELGEEGDLTECSPGSPASQEIVKEAGAVIALRARSDTRRANLPHPRAKSPSPRPESTPGVQHTGFVLGARCFSAGGFLRHPRPRAGPGPERGHRPRSGTGRRRSPRSWPRGSACPPRRSPSRASGRRSGPEAW